ncbi:tail fiber domain-containing protein [Winogradskyella pulchriflava]|uniref:Tail fiber domain-containing protein n=1 Tax=Winogradskyella pulchriflava TaxID=1110688 RepID=A0ABV6Q4E9_9FLAO
MKTITSLLVACLFCCVMYAQNNTINYKALVKDDLGNVVASQGINVRFTIYADAVQVYEETHNPTTDANGIIIIDIGSGTTVDVFADIDWSTTTSLKTEIDTGSGYVDMGTTAFKSVPYAINAGNTAFSTTANVTSNAPGDIDTDDFVFGSNQLNEDTSSASDDNRMFFDKSKGAFRAGNSNNTTKWDDENVGNFSFASGFNTTASDIADTALGFETTASGLAATAMGLSTTASDIAATAMGGGTTASDIAATAMGSETTASGYSATAMGIETTASGDVATAMGYQTTATADLSTSMGQNTKAEAFISTAIGRYNIGGGNQSTWIETDPLFEIGNGTSDANRTNALTVLKNGTITAPSFDMAEIIDPKALVTKEYADAQAGALSTTANVTSNAPGDIDTDDFVFGSIQLAHSAAPSIRDSRMFFDKSKSAFRAGATFNNDGISFPYDGTAWDDAYVGQSSFASGENTVASGLVATAMGFNSIASDYVATAMGLETTASGTFSTAFGFRTTASGSSSTAMGLNTKAEALGSTAIGRNNIGGGNQSTWTETDPLFEIGNGTNDANRTNALTVLKNGNTQISGRLSVGTNTISTSASLVIKGDNNNDMIRLIDNNDNNKWHIGLKSSGDDINFSETLVADGRLYLQKGGNVGINTTSPQNELHVMGGGDASLANGSGFFQIGSETVENLVFDTNEIIARNAGLASDLYLQAEGGNTRIGGPGGAPTHTLTVLGDAKVTNAIEGPEPAISGIKNYHSQEYLDAVGVLGQNTVNPVFGVGVEGQGGLMGVKGVALSNDNGAFSNFGAAGFAEGSNSGVNYGLYGSGNGAATNYGVYANGNMAFTGTLTNASDRKVKTNISTINNSLQDIMRLNPTSYLIKENYQKTMNMSSSPQFGFIAQELQEVFPDLVSENKHPGATVGSAPINYLGVNYIGLIPILTKGIQEQQQLIEKQNERIAVLEAQNKELLKDSAELDSIKQDIQLLKAQLGVISKSEAMTKLNTED